MDEDIKMNHEEGSCPECGEKLCVNCGGCCHCGGCKCGKCHPKEEGDETIEDEGTVNYS